MKVLLDTCVLSEIRHPQGEPRVRAMVSQHANDDLFLSVLTLGELTKGIAQLAAGRRKRELESWLSELHDQFRKQILPVDAETAMIWGEITAAARANGRTVPAIDGLIAATAIRHNLAVMTRNTEDFEPTGAKIINPWTPPGIHET